VIENNLLILNLLTLFNNERISFITCGFNHSVCLTENNLCLGYNDSGQLGLGDINDCYIPVLFRIP